jgi:hypothetical protein
VKRLLALLVALLLIAALAFTGRADPKDMAACFTKPTLMQRGTSIASHLDAVLTPLDCGSLLDQQSCDTPPPPSGGTQTPWNPKDASLQGLGGLALSGAELAADALRRAGFPASEIPTFVAIAEAESGFNPKAFNNYGAGMAGMFQLNQAYWKLPNWSDPYANAVMAKKVRDESVAKGASPYYPWSTWRGAVANAGKYARFSTSTPNQSAPPTTPPAECVASGGGPATVGQWNILFSNSVARVNANAGFADLVCLNEIRHNSALRVPGFKVTPGSMAVPIIWRPAKLENLELHRTTVLRGYARDKSVVHGVWRNRGTGEQFAALCTHMLVQGGSGWQKQAANVNRIKDTYRRRGLPTMVLADMNAPESKVLNFFSGKPTGGRIDFMVSYGLPQPKMTQLSNAGSDHARRLFTFPPTNAGQGSIGGSPVRFNQQGNPRTVEEAIAWITSKPQGAPGEPVSNRCERYMNLAYGLGAGYGTARSHWEASGPKSQGDPPRGALVFWNTSNSAGHVALSLGGGKVVSTDFDGTNFRSGQISVGPIEAIDRWGQRLGWRAPNFKVGSGQ